MFKNNIVTEEFYETLITELFSNFMSFGIAIAGFVLLALAMYTIAKRRGIRSPWLAWVPLGQSWMLGSISDQYRYVTKGQQKSKRTTLLWLEIGLTAVSTVVCVLLVYVIWKCYFNVEAGQMLTEQMLQQRIADVSLLLIAILLLSLALLVLAIAFAVIKYMALYDLYHSCDPGKAVLFTLLTVFLGTLAMGIMVMICRDKDLGMPPRRDQPMLNQPVYGLPPQPPKEPWDL